MKIFEKIGTFFKTKKENSERFINTRSVIIEKYSFKSVMNIIILEMKNKNSYEVLCDFLVKSKFEGTIEVGKKQYKVLLHLLRSQNYIISANIYSCTHEMKLPGFPQILIKRE